MVNESLYYTAPSDEIFEDIKQGARKLWETFDNTYGYADEKIATVDRVTNVGDNWMYLVAMFDRGNQVRLLGTLKDETTVAIGEALSE